MTPAAFSVTVAPGTTVTALHYVPREPSGSALIVAHGAGAGQHSAWMVAFATAMADEGVDAVTFNFPYTEQKRRLPDRAPVLEQCYRAVVEATRAHVASARDGLFIGGKSMGGRMATHIAAADPGIPVRGLVLLGYPLHPPGQPEKRRDAHLPSVGRRMLVVQGSRDTFGTADEIRPVFEALAPPADLFLVEGGDHSFKVARAGRGGQSAIDADIRRRVVEWITDVRASMRP